MKHPLLRGWRSYHQPPRLDVDHISYWQAFGFGVILALGVAGFSIIIGGM